MPGPTEVQISGSASSAKTPLSSPCDKGFDFSIFCAIANNRLSLRGAKRRGNLVQQGNAKTPLVGRDCRDADFCWLLAMTQKLGNDNTLACRLTIDFGFPRNGAGYCLDEKIP
jgi:hypothetical protein